ncbi:hypothetical protein [Clostridium weizhouense]|uniref:Uncharacterized protein n=1 Tax=Clostridium weizhouense TaxID=2859781 RepID=A0ABS7AN61_9CLOT|nr:hypothetical protein [Clostridium weizhouense]MBW6410084.1 hypothetical protein [Clostridium weizhouense]
MKKKKKNRNNEKLSCEKKVELLKQYSDYKLILNMLNAVVIAVLLNREFVKNEIVKIQDELNQKSSGLYNENLQEIPKKTNIIYVIVSGLFFLIEYGRYEEELKKAKESENYEELKNTWINALSALLVFIAVNMSYTNLEI